MHTNFKKLPFVLSLVFILFMNISSQKIPLQFTSHAMYSPPGPAQIIQNAQNWVQAKVDYNRAGFYPNAQSGYREDCSGYVSMAWQLPNQPNGGLDTNRLATITKSVAKDALQPGDILLNLTGGGNVNLIHAVIFAGWTDANGNAVSGPSHFYTAYEEQGGYYSPDGTVITPPGAIKTRNMPYPYWPESDGNENDYFPRRLDPTKVSGNPPSPPATIIPGGVWISPTNNQVLTNSVHFAAHAYPTDPSDPAIAFVKFTYNSQGVWNVACVVQPPITGDVFSCDRKLSDLALPLGQFLVSFDVYDQEGNVNLAPNGEHTLYNVPCSSYIDIGNPQSENGHQLSGWSPMATNQPPSPSGDTTFRYQSRGYPATLILCVLQANVAYTLTTEVQDFGCDDSFEIFLNNDPQPFYVFHGTRANIVRVHKIPVPANEITSLIVKLGFESISTDCGYAAVYNVSLS